MRVSVRVSVHSLVRPVCFQPECATPSGPQGEFLMPCRVFSSQPLLSSFRLQPFAQHLYDLSPVVRLRGVPFPLFPSSIVPLPHVGG